MILVSEAIRLPPGIVVPYVKTTAPAGWLLCDGSNVSRTTYAALFSVISTTYGAGDGSTTFGLPNLRGRVPIGRAASGTGSSLGATAIFQTWDLWEPLVGTGIDSWSHIVFEYIIKF